ncbi:hypothetical protein J1N35_026276 [Gossypium stocksii]|uniref:Uncharacterized protein n=1 Tax=Gossypium stocksii TaxID=47602 RepID=A0A9D3VAF6_9ROSI|nr:hypothetical protein J1N35_026276 [Gossypium stocksii]
MQESLEIVETRIEELDSTGDELKGEMHGAFNAIMDMLTLKNVALETVVMALMKKIKEFIGTMTPKHKIEVPKLKEFKGSGLPMI